MLAKSSWIMGYHHEASARREKKAVCVLVTSDAVEKMFGNLSSRGRDLRFLD